MKSAVEDSRVSQLNDVRVEAVFLEIFRQRQRRFTRRRENQDVFLVERENVGADVRAREQERFVFVGRVFRVVELDRIPFPKSGRKQMHLRLHRGRDQHLPWAQGHEHSVDVMIGDFDDDDFEFVAENALQPLRTETVILGGDVHQNVATQLQALSGVEHDFERVRPALEARKILNARIAFHEGEIERFFFECRARSADPACAVQKIVMQRSFHEIGFEVASAIQHGSLDDRIADDEKQIPRIVHRTGARGEIRSRELANVLEFLRPMNSNVELFQVASQAIEVFLTLFDEPALKIDAVLEDLVLDVLVVEELERDVDVLTMGIDDRPDDDLLQFSPLRIDVDRHRQGSFYERHPMNDGTVPPEFCSAPWRVLHISPQGEVHSCYESGAVLGNLHEKPLEEIWAGGEFVALRQKMLRGERVGACAKCHIKADAIEGRSLRTLTNERTGGAEALAALFESKDQKPELAPEILDLSFSNGCNLKCRMCSSTYSKAWIDDEMKAYGTSRGQARELSDEILREQIFPLLKTSVKKLTIAGGEPLLDRRNKELLRFLIENDRCAMTIEYNTNGTMADDETLELWRSFPNLRLALSLDASGERFEYLRKGARWSRVNENVRKIRSRVPSAALECYSTVSVFNALTHHAFMREVLETGLFSLPEMSLHYVVEPRHMSVRTLPPEKKARVQESLFAFMRDDLLMKHDFEVSKRLILQIKMLLNYMNAEQTDHLNEFTNVADRFDSLRGESFRQAFPELSDLPPSR